MTQSTTAGKESTGLDNTTYNIISALEREADFLYSTIETYIRDARNENRTDVEDLWKSIKESKRKNVQMLRQALQREAKQEKLTNA